MKGRCSPLRGIIVPASCLVALFPIVNDWGLKPASHEAYQKWIGSSIQRLQLRKSDQGTPTVLIAESTEAPGQTFRKISRKLHVSNRGKSSTTEGPSSAIGQRGAVVAEKSQTQLQPRQGEKTPAIRILKRELGIPTTPIGECEIRHQPSRKKGRAPRQNPDELVQLFSKRQCSSQTSMEQKIDVNIESQQQTMSATYEEQQYFQSQLSCWFPKSSFQRNNEGSDLRRNVSVCYKSSKEFKDPAIVEACHNASAAHHESVSTVSVNSKNQAATLLQMLHCDKKIPHYPEHTDTYNQERLTQQSSVKLQSSDIGDLMKEFAPIRSFNRCATETIEWNPRHQAQESHASPPGFSQIFDSKKREKRQMTSQSFTRERNLPVSLPKTLYSPSSDITSESSEQRSSVEQFDIKLLKPDGVQSLQGSVTPQPPRGLPKFDRK